MWYFCAFESSPSKCASELIQHQYPIMYWSPLPKQYIHMKTPPLPKQILNDIALHFKRCNLLLFNVSFSSFKILLGIIYFELL